MLRFFGAGSPLNQIADFTLEEDFMTLNSIKRSIRRYLPKWLFGLIQRIRRIGHRPSNHLLTLKGEFERRNAGNQDGDAIVLRDGLTIKIDKESAEPFSWFCWRSPEMVEELDFFISRVRGVESFADVGANHGIFSLVFLKLNPSGRVLSVDPSPLADRIRMNNRALNGVGFRIDLLSGRMWRAGRFRRYALQLAPLGSLREGG